MNFQKERLEATLDFSKVETERWDMVIIGAGPAGSVAACAAISQGIKILLVDKMNFPRNKVCGCCLNPQSLAILQSLRLDRVIQNDEGPPLKAFCLAAGGSQVTLPLKGGRALSRERLDSALIGEAISRNVGFLPGTDAKVGEVETDYRWVHLQQGEKRKKIRTRLILVADGLGGESLTALPEDRFEIALSSRIGIGAILESKSRDYPPGTIFMACAREGYVGIVRLEDGRLDIAAAMDRDGLRRLGSPGAAVCHVMEQAGFPSLDFLTNAPWKGTLPLTRRRRWVARDRYFILGDASGYVEPFTGEGIAWAITAAQAVAPMAREAILRWTPELIPRWTRLHRHLIGRRQELCRFLSQILKYPFLIQGLVRILSHRPQMVKPVLSYVQGV